MGKHYDQLSSDERYEIYRLHQSNMSLRQIGRMMGRSESTISRELERNALPRGEYKPASADRMAMSRRRRLSRIERLRQLRTYVDERLAMGWSPEQIVGRLKLEGSEHAVGIETIYRYIYRPRVRPEKLYRFLPRAKASRGRRYFKRRRDPLPGRRSIHERPETVALRGEFGHWEGDLMQFRTQRGNLLTVCERKTRFTLSAPLKTKTAAETGEALIDVLLHLPRAARKTMTFDNGGEFHDHRKLEAVLELKTFFCDPHSPWQRGTIENTNGILRRDMPRKTDITNYSAE
jgi:transposase, IS30 family